MRIFFCFLAALFFLSSSPAAATSDPLLTKHQRDVISYFREIALGFEYGTASAVTRKWNAPMKIYVSGDATESVLKELDLVIRELNSLATDGFYIERVGAKEISNFHMFFGTRAEFTEIYPADIETVKKSSGIFRIFWNKENYIQRGYAFIHTRTSEKEQRHAIREELTQALGMGKDSYTYDDSIFQSRWTLPTEYAPIDREIVRCLYHPLMKVGLTGQAVDEVLTTILLSHDHVVDLAVTIEP